MIRVTVCQLPDEPERLQDAWPALVSHMSAEGSDLVVLPEMAFGPWFARAPQFDAAVWAEAVADHDRWLAGLPELGTACVLGSRPVTLSDQRRNEGYVWDAAGGYRAAHHKRYLPNEPGFWEATWYGPGSGAFEPVRVGPATVGFMICTDLWFLEHARAYGRAGAHLIANPRGTERATVDKWLVGGRAAAVVSGCFILSSNRVSDGHGPHPMGGQGFVVGPDGEILATTSVTRPFATVPVDLVVAEHAKSTYPRYVRF